MCLTARYFVGAWALEGIVQYGSKAPSRGISALSATSSNTMSSRSAKARMCRHPIWWIRRSGTGSFTCLKTSRSVYLTTTGCAFGLLYQLWGDWLEAIGDPDKPDEMFDCRPRRSTAFRARPSIFCTGSTAWRSPSCGPRSKLVMIGAYGNLYPADKDYQEWKAGKSEIFGFTRCQTPPRALKTSRAKWMFEDDALPRLRIRNYANTRTPGPTRGTAYCGKVMVLCMTTHSSGSRFSQA